MNRIPAVSIRICQCGELADVVDEVAVSVVGCDGVILHKSDVV